MSRRSARFDSLFTPFPDAQTPCVAIIGGAGFIGCNLADSFANDGVRVRVIDTLARPGVERNLAWLRARHGQRLEAVRADVRDAEALSRALAGSAAIFHFAAQVAVTSSLDDPMEDFEINARGALNVLEWARRRAPQAPVVFASTNKVYGGLDDVAMMESASRHEPRESAIRLQGVSEAQPLALKTPYGCSKGAADQYTLDYAASFGLRTLVLRMSCIYGPRQWGGEDQGWVAHFARAALTGAPITIYGDGKQVRDVLHVRDAVAAYRLALTRIDALAGKPFNLGGGPANAVSLRDVIAALEDLARRRADLRFEGWRVGDQPWFVADARAFAQATGWRARTDWRAGLEDLVAWLREDIAAERAFARPRRSVEA